MLLLSGCQSPISRESQASQQLNLALGLGYLNQGNVLQAQSYLLKAVQEMPKNPMAWDVLAYYEEQTGNNPQARQYYQKAIALAPQGGASHNNYGAFLCRQQEFDQALLEFEKAMKDPYYKQAPLARKNGEACFRLKHQKPTQRLQK